MTAQKNEAHLAKEKVISYPVTVKTSRILAKSFYNELKINGFSKNDILAVSNEILSLVTTDIKEKRF